MSPFFKAIYAYLLLALLLTTVMAAEAVAYESTDLSSVDPQSQQLDRLCSYDEGDSWRALAQLTPYLSDLNLKRNFERTVGESQKLYSQLSEETSERSPFKGELSKQVLASIECSGELVENGDLCSDAVELPISTAPTLFTGYQAKRAANAVFETVNRFYRGVDANLREEGLKESSQPRKVSRLRFLHSTDAIAIKQLLSPRVAISEFFGSPELRPLRRALKKRVSRGSHCTKIESHGTSCERIPHDSFHGFKITSQPVASLPTFLNLLKAPENDSLQRLPFPPIGALAHQRITEVALPPPQSEETLS